jgi:hypothetical protein
MASTAKMQHRRKIADWSIRDDGAGCLPAFPWTLYGGARWYIDYCILVLLIVLNGVHGLCFCRQAVDTNKNKLWSNRDALNSDEPSSWFSFPRYAWLLERGKRKTTMISYCVGLPYSTWPHMKVDGRQLAAALQRCQILRREAFYLCTFRGSSSNHHVRNSKEWRSKQTQKKKIHPSSSGSSKSWIKPSPTYTRCTRRLINDTKQKKKKYN